MPAPWTTLAKKTVVEQTIAVLQTQNINALFVETRDDAKKKVLELLPTGAEVMTMSSTTLDQSGITQAIEESSSYHDVKKILKGMDRNTQGKEMQKVGAAPDWTVGSVHAVTQDGHVMIASNTGSQLPAYAYGSSHVIWVVGTHKIVKDMNEGMKRIYEHALVLENERAKKAYGMGSAVNKMLIINKEVKEGRITLIFVNLRFTNELHH